MLLRSTNISTNIFRNKFYRCFTTTNISQQVSKKICIVGAGPAGFYAAQYILKNLNNSYVDVIEKFPVPYGLVR